MASATVYACAAASMGWRWFAGAATFAGLIAFGAIYFRHHYVLDILAGAAYALVSYAVVTGIDVGLLRRRLRASAGTWNG
jgi:hypothetical protein